MPNFEASIVEVHRSHSPAAQQRVPFEREDDVSPRRVLEFGEGLEDCLGVIALEHHVTNILHGLCS